MTAAELDGAEIVTQYVTRSEARDRPRPKDQDALSVVHGQLTVNETLLLIRRGTNRRPEDGVRHATVQALRDVGFEVTLTPSMRNPRHCSVTYSGSWDDQVAATFETCFGLPTWHEED